MKKKLLLSVLAAGLVLPSAAALANETYNPVNNKATYTTPELGRAYAIAKADADVLKVQAETLSRIARHEENVLEDLKKVLEAKELAHRDVLQKWDNAKVRVGILANDPAYGPKSATYAEAVAVAESFAPVEAAARDEVAKAKEAVNKQAAKVAKALEDEAAGKAALAEGVAKLEAAYQAYLNAGGKMEDVPTVEKTGTVKVAEGAAAKSGSKVLPKTSAVK